VESKPETLAVSRLLQGFIDRMIQLIFDLRQGKQLTGLAIAAQTSNNEENSKKHATKHPRTHSTQHPTNNPNSAGRTQRTNVEDGPQSSEERR
jgi:hypothetical protein